MLFGTTTDLTYQTVLGFSEIVGRLFCLLLVVDKY